MFNLNPALTEKCQNAGHPFLSVYRQFHCLEFCCGMLIDVPQRKKAMIKSVFKTHRYIYIFITRPPCVGQTLYEDS